MPENDEFWDLFWEVRLQKMENLGKRVAIIAASKLMRKLSQQIRRPISLLELGCGTGQIIGTLTETHSDLCNLQKCYGIDINPLSLDKCRHDFPALKFIQGDITDTTLLNSLGKFDVLLIVNALHEVFSATYGEGTKRVDVTAAKQRVEKTLRQAAACLDHNGRLVLFDGLEPSGDPLEEVCILFLDEESRQDFDMFAEEYQPFPITYRKTGSPFKIVLPRRDFVRYIDKSIFLRKQLWQTERLESYQYFTEEEFRTAFREAGLDIIKLHILTMNEEKWRQRIELVSPGLDFPGEHILILAQPLLS